MLYSTEHGPSDNDEVNRIVAGRNYGWPTVHGTCDDDIGSERQFCQTNNVVEPLATWTPTIASGRRRLLPGRPHSSMEGQPALHIAQGRSTLSTDALVRWTARDGERDVVRRAIRPASRRARRPRRQRVSRDEQPRWPRQPGRRRRSHFANSTSSNDRRKRDPLDARRSTPSAADRSFDPRGPVAVARSWGWTLELFDTPRAIPPYEQQSQHLPTFGSHVPSHLPAVVGRQRSKS